MSKIVRHGPDAPTRLDANTQHNHLGTVYYISDSKLFVLIDRRAEPTFYNAVITEKLADGSVVIEPYEGQRHIGVVRILEHWAPGLYAFALQIFGLSGLIAL